MRVVLATAQWLNPHVETKQRVGVDPCENLCTYTLKSVLVPTFQGFEKRFSVRRIMGFLCPLRFREDDRSQWLRRIGSRVLPCKAWDRG
jgi:hypothetical protein